MTIKTSMLFALLCSGLAFPDVVTLKDGTRLAGWVEGTTRDIRIHVGDSLESVPIDRIQSIRFTPVDETGPPVNIRRTPPSLFQDSEINAGSAGAAPPPEVSRSLPSAGAPADDTVLQMAMQAERRFSEALPDYVVKQFTTRYQTNRFQGERTAWQALDVVTADVAARNGKESYSNIQINGKAPRDAIEKTGSWSTGEIVSTLRTVLYPATGAHLSNRRDATIANHAAFEYDFSVDQGKSTWSVYAGGQSYKPGYAGQICFDKENFGVLRIAMSAVNLPQSFLLNEVKSTIDYDYVWIADGRFLLPRKSESMSCLRTGGRCTRNVIDFRNYRKPEADASAGAQVYK